MKTMVGYGKGCMMKKIKSIQLMQIQKLYCLLWRFSIWERQNAQKDGVMWFSDVQMAVDVHKSRGKKVYNCVYNTTLQYNSEKDFCCILLKNEKAFTIIYGIKQIRPM